MSIEGNGIYVIFYPSKLDHVVYITRTRFRRTKPYRSLNNAYRGQPQKHIDSNIFITSVKNTTHSITHRQVWQLAWPIIISNLSVPLVGITDTAVMGYLDGPHFIGAVALGALIFSVFYWGFGFLKMSTVGFIARASGEENHDEVQLILWRAIVLAGLVSAILLLLQQPILNLALNSLEGSERVENLTATYYSIRIWSAPATLIVYALTGAMIGLKNTRGALIIQLVLNVTNITLNLLFVPMLNYGVAGLAWASVIAEYGALLVGLYLLRRLLFAHIPDTKKIFDAAAVTGMMRANVNIFIRTLLLVFSFSWFTAKGAQFGDLILAANAILINLQHFIAHGLDGYAHAVEALGGNAFGAGKRRFFIQVVNKTLVGALVFSGIFTIYFFFFGELSVSLFTNQQDITLTALEYLPWLIISPLVSVWCFHLDGIFVGTSKTAEMRNAMIVSTLIYLGILYWSVPAFGNHGLWLGITLFMVIRAATLGYYFPRILKELKD